MVSDVILPAKFTGGYVLTTVDRSGINPGTFIRLVPCDGGCKLAGEPAEEDKELVSEAIAGLKKGVVVSEYWWFVPPGENPLVWSPARSD